MGKNHNQYKSTYLSGFRVSTPFFRMFLLVYCLTHGSLTYGQGISPQAVTQKVQSEIETVAQFNPGLWGFLNANAYLISSSLFSLSIFQNSATLTLQNFYSATESLFSLHLPQFYIQAQTTLTPTTLFIYINQIFPQLLQHASNPATPPPQPLTPEFFNLPGPSAPIVPHIPELTQAYRTIHDQESKISDLQQRKKQDEKSRQKLFDQKENVRQQLENKEKELESSSANLSTAQSQLQSLQQEVDRLTQENKENDKSEELKQAQTVLNQAQEKVNQLKREKEIKEREKKILEEKIQTLENQLNAANETIQNLSNQIDELQSTNQSQQEELQLLYQQLTALQNQQQALENENEELKQELEEKDQALKEKDQALIAGDDERKKDQQSANEELRRTKKQRNRSSHQLARSKKANEKLTQKNDKLAEENQRLREKLKLANSKAKSKVLTTGATLQIRQAPQCHTPSPGNNPAQPSSGFTGDLGRGFLGLGAAGGAQQQGYVAASITLTVVVSAIAVIWYFKDQIAAYGYQLLYGLPEGAQPKLQSALIDSADSLNETETESTSDTNTSSDSTVSTKTLETTLPTLETPLETPCTDIQSPVINQLCLNRNDPLEQQLVNRLSAILPQLLIVQYSSARLDKEQRIFWEELPPAGMTRNKNKDLWLLLPSRIKPLSGFEDRQQSTFLGLLLDHFDTTRSLVDHLQTTAVYARLCGVMLPNHDRSCFSKVQKMLDTLGLEKLTRQLSTFPSKSTDIDQALSQGDTLAILPAWTPAFDSEPAYIPLIAVNHHLELLLDSNPGEYNKWLVPETGTYTPRQFSHPSRKRLIWEKLKNPVIAGAGTDVKLIANKKGVLVLDSEELHYAAICANHNGKPLSLAWTPDFRLNDTLAQLLLALFNQERAQETQSSLPPEELQEWLHSCQAKTDQCQFPKRKLHNGTDLIKDSASPSLFEQTELVGKNIHYLPSPKKLTLNKLSSDYLTFWLGLVNSTFDAFELSRYTDLPAFAEDARQFCGVFMGTYKKRHLQACFIQLAQLHSQTPSWKQQQNALWFQESFQASASTDETRLAVAVVWPAYSSHSLGRPRFLPILETEKGRFFQLKGERELQRTLPPVPTDQQLMLLRDDLSLAPALHPSSSNLDELFNIHAGSYVLASLSNPQEQYFIAHRNSPFLADPVPAFSADDRLYKPEYVYPLTLFPYREDNRVDPDHGTNRVSAGQMKCSTLGSQVLINACIQLTQEHGEEAASLLLQAVHRNANTLVAPQFALMGTGPLGGSLEQQPRDDAGTSDYSPIYTALQAADQNSGQTLRLIPYRYSSLDGFPQALIVHQVIEALKIMKQHQLQHGRDKALFTIFTHCGLLAEPLWSQCATRMISLLIQQKSHIDPSDRHAYHQSCGQHVIDTCRRHESEGAPYCTVLQVNWHFKKDRSLADSPSYRLGYLNTRQGYMEIYPPDNDQSRWSQYMTLSGLAPDTHYDMWVYLTDDGTWSKKILRPSDFSTEAHDTVMHVQLPINKILGLSKSGEPGPSSFFYIPVSLLPADATVNHDTVRHNIPRMPPTTWPQKIQLNRYTRH